MSRDYYLCCKKHQKLVFMGNYGYIRKHTARNVCFFIEEHRDCEENIFIWDQRGDFDDIKAFDTTEAPNDWNEWLSIHEELSDEKN